MGLIQAGVMRLVSAAITRAQQQRTQGNVTGAASNHAGQADTLRGEGARKAARDVFSKRGSNKNPLLDGLVRVGEVADKRDHERFQKRPSVERREADEIDDEETQP